MYGLSQGKKDSKASGMLFVGRLLATTTNHVLGLEYRHAIMSPRQCEPRNRRCKEPSS
jgi:hypothetical protein